MMSLKWPIIQTSTEARTTVHLICGVNKESIWYMLLKTKHKFANANHVWDAGAVIGQIPIAILITACNSSIHSNIMVTPCAIKGMAQ